MNAVQLIYFGVAVSLGIMHCVNNLLRRQQKRFIKRACKMYCPQSTRRKRIVRKGNEWRSRMLCLQGDLKDSQRLHNKTRSGCKLIRLLDCAVKQESHCYGSTTATKNAQHAAHSTCWTSQPTCTSQKQAVWNSKLQLQHVICQQQLLQWAL